MNSLQASTSAGAPSEGGKQKKTRRRLRLSCTECTKRRQKCDREHPCGLCKARDVAHLCRWESHPVARPTPARPPSHAPQVVPSQAPANPSNFNEIATRLALLERVVLRNQSPVGPASPSTSYEWSQPPQPRQNISYPTSYPTTPDVGYPNPSDDSYATSSSSSTPNVSMPMQQDKDVPSTMLTTPIFPLSPEVHETALALAQLSMGHHGEYAGKGSIISTLHKLGHPQNSRYPYAKSTDAVSSPNPDMVHRVNWTVSEQVQALLTSLPQKPQADFLIQTFFEHVNWRFGIPEIWFQKSCVQTWTAVSSPNRTGGEVNIHWLSLLFVVLAFGREATISAQTAREPTVPLGEMYFRYAWNARRLAEDACIDSPTLSLITSAIDGIALGCIAAQLFCVFLTERGRISEGWKLAGCAVRNAQSAGMHRDPGLQFWQAMSDEEKSLRTRAWWGVVILDQLNSYVLGRPSMTQKNTCDVSPPALTHPNGLRHYDNIYQSEMLKLSCIANDINSICFSIPNSRSEEVFNLDQQVIEWYHQMPSDFRYRPHQFPQDIPHELSTTAARGLCHQRYVIYSWFLVCRLKLHLSFMTPSDRNRPSHSLPLSDAVRKSCKECLSVATDLARIQCDTFDYAHQERTAEERAINVTAIDWNYEGTYSLFDAAVALVLALTYTPMEERTEETEQLVDRACVVIERVKNEEVNRKGEIACRAVAVLNTLRSETGWRRTGMISSASHPPTVVIARPVPSQPWLQTPATQHLLAPTESPFAGAPDGMNFPSSSAPHDLSAFLRHVS